MSAVGKYNKVAARTGYGIVGRDAPRPTDSQLEELLVLSHDPDPKARRVALKNLCPCRVQRRRDEVWERIFDLAHDDDAGVRYDAIHAMVDGSPRALAPRIYDALAVAQHDPDRKIRRFARILGARQRRTGRVNVG